jgi:hypothetical protein
MWNRQCRLVCSFTVISFVSFVTCAHAQVTCIQTYLSDPNRTALGFAPSDVDAVVSKVANSIGLSPSGIRVIPCDGVANVQSAYYSRDDIPNGDYILYDPVWVRQVIGTDVSGVGTSKSHDEAIFLFGHELGHLLLRHFTSNSALPRIRKEMDADHFGGCAAGALGANWENVADLINRIRGDFDTDYPSRANSLATARAGFDTCSRPSTPTPQATKTPAAPSPPPAEPQSESMAAVLKSLGLSNVSIGYTLANASNGREVKYPSKEIDFIVGSFVRFEYKAVSKNDVYIYYYVNSDGVVKIIEISNEYGRDQISIGALRIPPRSDQDVRNIFGTLLADFDNRQFFTRGTLDLTMAIRVVKAATMEGAL